MDSIHTNTNLCSNYCSIRNYNKDGEIFLVWPKINNYSRRQNHDNNQNIHILLVSGRYIPIHILLHKHQPHCIHHYLIGYRQPEFGRYNKHHRKE